MKIENLIKELKNNVEKEKKVARELGILYKQFIGLKGDYEKKMITSQIQSLKKHLKEANDRAFRNLKAMYLAKPLPKIVRRVEQKSSPNTVASLKTKQKIESSPNTVASLTEKAEPAIVSPKQPVQKGVELISPQKAESVQDVVMASLPQQVEQPVQEVPTKRKKLIKLSKELKLEGLEKETLKRLLKKEKKVEKKKEKTPNTYAKKANKFFSSKSIKVIGKKMFKTLERDLIKANMQYTPTTYISIIYFTTFISIFVAIFLAVFFLFFKVTAELPIITLTSENIGIRFLKVIWLVAVIPIITFFIMYFYPSLEKKSTAYKIDHELPFATINMAAISGSLIDPSKIFSIIITTKEYPYLAKEFTKIINEINIHGYNFVSALRKASFNRKKKKLSELLSGLATTINSGGDLPNFFDERSKSLLFEHRIEQEKESKAAETFMDIYISLVVAAPMILMLLLVMMKVSGLGISMSTNTITLIMVLGVTIINIVFLTFLQIKNG